VIDYQTSFIPLGQIICDRDSRQRSTINEGKVRELAVDIFIHGLIHPILVERDTNKLIAGEHRLQAYALLLMAKGEETWTTIPCHFAYDVAPEELEALELSENIKRTEMTWQDSARAILRYHQLQENLDREWGVSRTASALGIAPGTASKHLSVAKELNAENPRVVASGGLTAAYNTIQRNQSRAIADELASMDDIIKDSNLPDIGTSSIDIDLSGGNDNTEYLAVPKPEQRRPASPILNLSFLTWAEEYSGPKFNLLHCDFPYGIGHDKSDQGNTAAWGEYDDSADTYWELLGALCSNLDRILLPSAHIVFWLAGDHEMHERTRQFFSVQAPTLTINPRPLIWHKSDNKGILPDYNRGPRYTYETALFISRGDRQVVQAVANSYAAPTARNRIHASEKPEPMLRHFFRMLVDEHTTLLDPTCGSGSALRAADSLGAKFVLGLEMNTEFAETAADAFTRASNLAKLTEEN